MRQQRELTAPYRRIQAHLRKATDSRIPELDIGVGRREHRRVVLSLCAQNVIVIQRAVHRILAAGIFSSLQALPH
jgi:hypothetical protein